MCDDTKDPTSRNCQCLVDLVRMHQQQIWERRKIHWKLSLALWTAIGLFTWFFVSQHTYPVPACLTFLVFLTMWGLYSYMIVFGFTSNEMDYAWLLYYKDKADESVGLEVDDPAKRPPSPEDKRWGYLCDKGAAAKAVCYLPQIIVTLGLFLLGWWILCTMPVRRVENDHTREELRSRTTQQKMLRELRKIRKAVE